jgi:hypothetical protein
MPMKCTYKGRQFWFKVVRGKAFISYSNLLDSGIYVPLHSVKVV